MLARSCRKVLEKWRDSPHRKPLVLRGARQVGKTALVRELGKDFDRYIELNFDENPDKNSFFEGRTVEQCITLLEIDAGIKLEDEKTLLFLDEVQAAPAVFPMLRYFYEKRPGLHVIAAGSLLEFLLADHSFSMPVGRIEYCFLTPFTFEEFLFGLEQKPLVEYLENLALTDSIPLPIHEKLKNYLQLYQLIGGMPEACVRWIETEDFTEVQRVHAEILQTYQDDFSKYRMRLNPDLLRTSMKAVPRLVGSKIRYNQISQEAKPSNLRNALDLLDAAKVISLIHHSSGNGVPLGAEVNPRKFKAQFLDIGLLSSSLSLRLLDFHNAGDLMTVNSGACAEQYVGQELLARGPTWIQPELFYWHREKRGSNAEVDFLINEGPQVLPVEVKDGKTGSLRSLHTFMASKQKNHAVRFNADVPSLAKVSAEINQVGKVKYQLLSLPLYMTGQLSRLVESVI